MKQLYAFIEVDRNPAERTISVAYYALFDLASHNENIIPVDSARWFSLKNAPKLILDWPIMVEKPIARLRKRVLSKPIGFEFLHEKFTIRQLHILYESFLDKKSDKRNFINEVNPLDILIKLGEKAMTVCREGAYLFLFDKNQHNKKVLEALHFRI